MKKSLRGCLLLLLTAALLTVPALADMGPKPLLTVRVEHAPEEGYYLDLLAEGDYVGYTYGGGSSPYSGLDWSYANEKAEELDEGLLSALRAAIPDGWHACTAEGTNGAPMWGQLFAEADDAAGNPLHQFGYMGVPETYRVLMVTQSGETWVSETMTRRVLQSSATVDWAEKTLSAPPVWTGYALQFLSTLLPTLVVEGLVLLSFGYHWKRSWKPFLLVNLVTQGALAALFSISILQNGTNGFLYAMLFVPAEIVVALVELGLYRRYLTERTPARATVYALTANLCSAVLGFYLAEPIWRFVVSIS